MSKIQIMRAIVRAIQAGEGFVPCAADMARDIVNNLRLRPEVVIFSVSGYGREGREDEIFHDPASAGIVVEVIR